MLLMSHHVFDLLIIKAFDAWLKVRMAHDRDLRKQREAHESADRMRRENEEKTKSSDALNVFTAWYVTFSLLNFVVYF